MHELSIALSILDLVAEEAERRQCRVAAVHLRLGPLAGVVRSALTSSFDMAREGTPLERTELIVEEVPVVVYCPTCAAERPLAVMHELRCPDCGTPTPQIVRGRELEVFALEVDT
jgi:hydrogenase nickel incorporation protein HypA/HybF